MAVLLLRVMPCLNGMLNKTATLGIQGGNTLQRGEGGEAKKERKVTEVRSQKTTLKKRKDREPVNSEGWAEFPP